MEKRTVIMSLLCSGVLIGALALLATARQQPETVRLWPHGAPGAPGETPEDVPEITVYRPAARQSNGTAVVICPGGGYGILAPHEGRPVAEWLTTLGVTGVVLKYRLGPRYRHPAMQDDVLRAIRLVRSRAAEWQIDPGRVGVMGFSAGGHLAATAATRFTPGNPTAPDPVDRQSSRPDFAVLIYPVITMSDPFTHRGSRQNLLGDAPGAQQIEALSLERQVTDRTPPTFLVHSVEDRVVPFENSLMFVQACRKHGVPVEFHLYETGPHGFGLGAKNTPVGTWPLLCASWMRQRGLLENR
ncbi:MAG: alpha/beta hydrolase [Chloroherpetonaceae bacterium]|nr:alpha/beta hydrolase [Chthonomonadaceae bacterium]MDW8207795.1 alpha/beta hydrolase [Chloroherpetonaceae bacterium]